MIELLNKELNIRVLVNNDNPDVYYLSYQGLSKCVINLKEDNNNLIMIPIPQGDCTVEELNKIIECFTDYILRIKPEVNGILFKMDSNSLLEDIGFRVINEESEYLYKENKRVNKVR